MTGSLTLMVVEGQNLFPQLAPSQMWMQAALNFILGVCMIILSWPWAVAMDLPRFEQVSVFVLVLVWGISRIYLIPDLLDPAYDGPQRSVLYLLLNASMAFFGTVGLLAYAVRRTVRMWGRR